MNSILNEKSKFWVDSKPDELFQKLDNHLKPKGWKKTLRSNSQLKLKYRIRTSFKSWGEILTIKISEVESQKSLIEITSKPILFTTLLDYGKKQT